MTGLEYLSSCNAARRQKSYDRHTNETNGIHDNWSQTQPLISLTYPLTLFDTLRQSCTYATTAL